MRAALEAQVDQGRLKLGLDALYRLPAMLEVGLHAGEAGDVEAASQTYPWATDPWSGADARSRARVEVLRGRLAVLGGSGRDRGRAFRGAAAHTAPGGVTFRRVQAASVRGHRRTLPRSSSHLPS